MFDSGSRQGKKIKNTIPFNNVLLAGKRKAPDLKRRKSKPNVHKKKSQQGTGICNKGSEIKATEILDLGIALGLQPIFSDNDTLNVIQRHLKKV